MLFILIGLAASLAPATTQSTGDPEVSELTALLSKPIDSAEVRAFAKKYGLHEGHKFDSGSFTSKDNAYSLWFERNRIQKVILQVAPWQWGDANWAVYSRPLPRGLRPSDTQSDAARKLGKPTESGAGDGAWDRWADGDRVIQVSFQPGGGQVEDVWISAPPAKP